MFNSGLKLSRSPSCNRFVQPRILAQWKRNRKRRPRGLSSLHTPFLTRLWSKNLVSSNLLICLHCLGLAPRDAVQSSINFRHIVNEAASIDSQPFPDTREVVWDRSSRSAGSRGWLPTTVGFKHDDAMLAIEDWRRKVLHVHVAYSSRKHCPEVCSCGSKTSEYRMSEPWRSSQSKTCTTTESSSGQSCFVSNGCHASQPHSSLAVYAGFDRTQLEKFKRSRNANGTHQQRKWRRQLVAACVDSNDSQEDFKSTRQKDAYGRHCFCTNRSACGRRSRSLRMI